MEKLISDPIPISLKILLSVSKIKKVLPFKMLGNFSAFLYNNTLNMIIPTRQILINLGNGFLCCVTDERTFIDRSFRIDEESAEVKRIEEIGVA